MRVRSVQASEFASESLFQASKLASEGPVETSEFASESLVQASKLASERSVQTSWFAVEFYPLTAVDDVKKC